MDKKIDMKSTSGFSAIVNPIILRETQTTRLIFRAMVLKNEKNPSDSVKGWFIFQKKKLSGSWENYNSFPLSKLKDGEWIKLELKSSEIKKLLDYLPLLKELFRQHGIPWGESSFRITDQNAHSIISQLSKVRDKKKLKKALEQLPSEGISNLSENLLIGLQIYKKEQTITQFKEKLKKELPESNWQKWIYENNWLFGVNYKKPIQKEKINIEGIMPDYLFPTIDGFVDILEIKLPADEVIIEDKNHSGAWKWTPKANEAIGQIVNYLGEIDRLRLEIEKKYRYKISFLKPRAYILIGNSSGWPTEKKEGLRKLNYALHGIEILTYKDLLDRGQSIIAQLNNEQQMDNN